MESGLLLDVVVRESPAIFELFASKDQSLLVWRDTFLVLNLCLDVLNSVRWLNLESYCLACQRLHEDLHTSSKPQNKVESGLFLNVVVGQSPAILQLFTGKDQPLLVRRDALLILDLGFHILDGIGGFHLEGDGFPCQGFDENPHFLFFLVCCKFISICLFCILCVTPM